MNLFNKKFIFTASVISIIVSSLFSYTLEEKIALARHLADEGASGKAQTGRVVSGNFDFNAELEKFQNANNHTSTQIVDVTDEDMSQTVEPINAVPTLEPIKNENIIEDVVVEPITADESIEKKAQTQKTEPENLQAQTPVVPVENKVKAESKPKYVIDTSETFINGYFAGTIDGNEEDIEDAKKINEKLDELDKEYNANVLAYSSNLFELNTDDKSVHSLMMSVVNACEQVINYYFTSDKSSVILPTKIRLKVSTKADKNIKGNFAFSISDLGDTSLFVYFNKSLKFNDFCRVVAGAVLRKLAYTYGGTDAVEKVPAWLEFSFGKMLEQYLAYGVVSELADVSDKNPLMDIEHIFALKRDSINDVDIANSYWVLQSLPVMLNSKKASAKFITKALLGDSSKDLISYLYKHNKTLLKPDGEVDMLKFNLWWRAILTGELWQRKGGVLDFERSESEIARLALIQANTTDDRRIGFTPNQVFDNIENLKSEVELRLMEIKLSFMKINPAYYNCLVSLGKMFEAILDEDEDDFAQAHQLFVEDITFARILAKQADAYLNDDNIK